MTARAQESTDEQVDQATWRERKKQATRRSIRKAALRLAQQHGVDRVTVEEISAAAEVSPRTFFNYFPSKEDALVDDTTVIAARLSEGLRARPAAEPPFRALRAAIEESNLVAASDDVRPDLLARMGLRKNEPNLVSRQMAQYMHIERSLTGAFAERLGVDPDRDPRPALYAALSVTAARVTLHRWAAGDSRPLEELADEALALLERAE